MKINLYLIVAVTTLLACNEQTDKTEIIKIPVLTGTWKLVSAKIITKKDTVITFPVANQEMIKMFTDKEFAFFKHNVNQTEKDSAVFDAGSGTYKLAGDSYSEHLTYCNYRKWENQDFDFKLRLHNDSLIQTGIEKIDNLDVDREIIEIYVRQN